MKHTITEYLARMMQEKEKKKKTELEKAIDRNEEKMDKAWSDFYSK